MSSRESVAQVDHVGEAEAHMAAGDDDAALRVLDGALARPHAPDFRSAVRLAAAIHARRGMLTRSADLFRHVPLDALGDDAPAAALALIGVGDVRGAGPVLKVATHGSPTSAAAGMRATVHGVRLSLDGDGAAALPALVQAASAIEPLGDEAELQDSPSALAALVALHLGELELADSVLRRALAADLGGATFRGRHHVLLAWTAMLQGDLAAASTLLDSVGDDHDLRTSLFAHGARVGIARRSSDIAALAAAWATARGVLPSHSVDLYSLLPLGELAVAAARLRDDHRVVPHLDASSVLLESLGNPPLWSASFRWYGVQAAILAERPAELLPHADALVAAAQVSRHARLLASAGQTWLRILRDDVDPVAVRQSVQDLDGIGLSWDASRLAAQAAARTSDRQAMLDLLQAARSVQRFSVVSANASPRADEPAGQGNLTEREWEIALHVVQGTGYREIGERLFISPKTVEHHVASIRRRLGAANRREMLATLKRLVDAGSAPSA